MNSMRCPLCYGDGEIDPIIIAQPITQHLLKYNRILNEKDEILRELLYLRDRDNKTVKRGGKRRRKKRNVTLKKKKK